MSATGSYTAFLERKSQVGTAHGFEPTWIPDEAFPFQRFLTTRAIRRGRAATFAGCGLGKSLMHLTIGENVVRHTNKPFLYLTPLAVGPQTVREATKFNIDAFHSRDGRFPAGARVVITNYQQLHRFNPSDFGGVGGDESGCLKDADTRTTATVTDFLRTVPYRFLLSAEPAPNDWDELGTSAEALGEMGYQDMLTRFFHKQTGGSHYGWGRLTYRMRSYAERDFWRWVCSWATACRKPSDLGLGFSDEGYILPGHDVHVHEVKALQSKPGHLFDLPAYTVQDQAEERRRTMPERCGKMAELASCYTGESVVCWCNLNAEGDLLEKMIPGAVQVSGSDPDEAKEEAFAAFETGQIRCIITKPSIAGYGLNWQHCAHQCLFPDHSYERFHQSTHRLLRFGQRRRVRTDIITTDGASSVLDNMKRKSEQSERMFGLLVRYMNDTLKVERDQFHLKSSMEVPTWLSPIRN